MERSLLQSSEARTDHPQQPNSNEEQPSSNHGIVGIPGRSGLGESWSFKFSCLGNKFLHFYLLVPILKHEKSKDNQEKTFDQYTKSLNQTVQRLGDVAMSSPPSAFDAFMERQRGNTSRGSSNLKVLLSLVYWVHPCPIESFVAATYSCRKNRWSSSWQGLHATHADPLSQIWCDSWMLWTQIVIKEVQIQVDKVPEHLM